MGLLIGVKEGPNWCGVAIGCDIPKSSDIDNKFNVPMNLIAVEDIYVLDHKAKLRLENHDYRRRRLDAQRARIK